ncbi:hypothetical protein WJX77_008030 [Trebouxia sp. C0004]
MQASPASRARPSSDLLDPQPAWMAPSSGHRPHWAQRQQRQQTQQQQPARQPKRLPSDRAANDDTVDVLGVPVSHPQLSEWRKLWELASAAYFDRQHRILWWRILHGCVMCGAFSAYIGRATPQQACCPFACCCTPAQPQTISHMFLECPVAATVVSWLCRLWQAMTGYMPVASVATILAASTPDGQCSTDAHTSLHVLQPRDAQVAIDTSIRPFCAASGSQLNASKSQAFLVQSQPLASATINALPSIRFITGQQTVKHLGVLLGYDMSAACHQTFTSIHQAIKAKVRHWSARGMSFLGRVHVGKQVLATSLWYHATFQQPPKQLLQRINRQLSQLLSLRGIQALQAKVVSRLLEPERLAWNVFQLHHLSDAPRTRALAYGATILFSTISIGCLQLPARLTGYVLAFRALRPHRLLKINAMPAEDVLNEPIDSQTQQQQPARQPKRLPSDRAANDDTVDVLGVPVSHPQLSEWRKLWELASAAYFDRQHRILWWRILHGCVMYGAFSAYIGRATPQQACCPFACCCTPAQPQTISHMFLECPVAATVVSWLCRLWQAMTGYMPVASVATILAASTPDGQCSTDALFQTWHRLRLAVLHSIWTAARITASSTHGLAPPQASPSQSRSHLASGLALKTITSMIRHDWVKCRDDVRQISGLCSSWLRGKDPSMTLGAFQHLWCHNHALASVHTVETGPEGRLELRVHLSTSSPVPLF